MTRAQRPMLMLVLCCACASTASAVTPQQIGIDQRLGQTVPLDTTFRDEAGRQVTLRELSGGRPIVLALVYYQCPMLCTMTLNGITKPLRALPQGSDPGMTIIAISIDPTETPALAAEKKRHYLRQVAGRLTDGRWRFLTGTGPSIDRVARAVGFRYQYDPQSRTYAHAAGLVVLSPDGLITRYLMGTEYAWADLKRAVDSAAAGKPMGAVPEILLYCLRYDPSTGRYSLVISRAVQLLGLVTVLAVGTVIGRLAWKEHRAPGPGSGEGGA